MAKLNSLAVRAYVYGLLNGNVTYNASSVPVTARAFAGIGFPYIQIRSTGFVEDGTKNSYGGVYSVDVEIADRSKINEGGQDSVETIANTVLGLIPVRAASSTLNSTESLISANVVSVLSINEEDEHFHYERCILKLECIVHGNG